MLRLLERSVDTVEQRLVLVAPPEAEIPVAFSNAIGDPTLREALVRQAQRLRGAVYLEDGAIRREQVTADGRHCTPEDGQSWHLLFLDAANRVSSAIWFLLHDENVSVDQLRIRHCGLTHLRDWRDRVFAAAQSELARARLLVLAMAKSAGGRLPRRVAARRMGCCLRSARSVSATCWVAPWC
jgi:hypothetical protein